MATNNQIQNGSALERKFSWYWLHVVKGPAELEQEHRFHSTRKWRFDFAHTGTKTAIEIEGGIFSNGRHTRGSGFRDDCEKYNEATRMGWRVFRLTADMVNSRELERIVEFIKSQPVN